MITPQVDSLLLRSESQESVNSIFSEVPLDPPPLLPSAPDASSNPSPPVDPKRVSEIKRGCRFATLLGVALLVAGIAMIIIGAMGLWFAPPAGGVLIGTGILTAVSGIFLWNLAEGIIENLDKPS